MHATRTAAATLAVLSLAILPAAPATAASHAVRAKALHQPSVYEGYYTVVAFEYQCPTGSTATLYVSISQPGTGAFYDSTSREPKPVPVCDGEKHRTYIGVISLGYDESTSVDYDAPYLQDTAQGYGRGLVTVSVTADGRTATDTTRVTVQSRDV